MPLHFTCSSKQSSYKPLISICCLGDQARKQKKVNFFCLICCVLPGGCRRAVGAEASLRMGQMEGLIPFVCGAIKSRRRVRKTMEYGRLASPAGGAAAPPTPPGRAALERRFAGGDSRYYSVSQSCRFAARPAAVDALGRSRDGDGDGGGGRSRPEGLSADGDGRRLVSRSRRFSSMRLFGCVGGA